MDDSFDLDPESGEAIAIPLVERCPRLRAMFEALRHELHPPDFSDCDTHQSKQPRSARSKSLFTSSESQSQSKKQELAPFQQTITPPTDAECGLPSAVSEALSKIPTNLLPLSRALASPQVAAVINGHSRSELSEAFAHAANLRRASGRARAILVITSSESAVREWIAGMCQVLDEVQVISYSRAKTKRQATLLRLSQAQYPGIVVAAERSLKDGIRDLWEALRQNRVAKKWEIVFSEVVTDKSIEGECSPLRMIRDGTAEKGIMVARKGLTKKRSCTLASELHCVEVEKGFWLSKEDIRRRAREEARKERGDALEQQPAPRRRSPRLCSSLSADRESTLSATGKGQSKPGKRKSRELRKVPQDGLEANRSATGKKQRSRSLGSSKISSDNDRGSMSDSELGDEDSSSKTRKMIKSRAHALRLYSTGSSSNSSEEKFYTPPSRAPTPQSKETTPEKFFSPRTSFSPKKPSRVAGDRLPKSRKTRPDHFVRLSLSPTKPIKSQIIKKVASQSHKATVQKSFSSGSPCSPIRRADLTKTKDKRLDVGCSSSVDQRLSRKTGRNVVTTTAKNRMLDSNLSDDHRFLGNGSRARENTRRNASTKVANNRGSTLSYDSSDDQPLLTKLSEKKERMGRKAVTAATKNMKLGTDLSNVQPFIRKRASVREKKRRGAVRPAAQSRVPDLSYDSSDDRPLLSTLLAKIERAVQNEATATTKNRKLDLDSSEDQPLARKRLDFKQKSTRQEGEGASTPRSTKRKFPPHGPLYVQRVISPLPVGRSVPLHSSPNLAAGAGKSGGDKRRSVFDEFRNSSDGGLRLPHTAIPRAKSFPAGPIQVKREDSPPRQPFIWTWGNPKYKKSRAANRRKSLPTSSSGSSILPVKEALPKVGKKTQVTRCEAKAPRHVPRLPRASPSNRHGSGTPRRKSPIVEVAAQARPKEPEVIVISSGTEDEVTPRQAKPARKRRIYDQGEARNDSGSVLCARAGNDTSSTGKSPSPFVSRSRGRLANGNSVGSRNRSTRHNESAAVADSDDLRNFMRGINRKRNAKDLSHKQSVKYNKLVAEAQRFENMGMRKEAIDSYEKCVHIYDGDLDLINRYLALVTKEGCIVKSDIPRRPAKSPIRKRSRRRRNSGRRGQAGPSNHRVEMIDLTSA